MSKLLGKSRVSLFLMEQVIAVVVFALAAVLCVQIFVYSHLQSAANLRQDQAMLIISDAVEVCQSTHGNLQLAGDIFGAEAAAEAPQLALYYDSSWQQLSAPGQDTASYLLTLSTQTAPEQPLLVIGHATVTRLDKGEEIAALDFAAQGVLP